MGLAQYYRAYVRNFAEISAPLTQMLRRGEKVEPTEARLKAFEHLKGALISPPILGLPQDDGEYVIEADASQKSLGAVCSQYQNGTLRVIEFASRRFSRTEENFCVTRREILALVFALRQFRPYVLGRHFRLVSDHQILQYFDRSKEPIGQMARHLDFLSDFDFTLDYRQGTAHQNCDSLSRIRPCEQNGGSPCDQCHKRVTKQHVNAVVTRSKAKINQQPNIRPMPPSKESQGNDSVTQHPHAVTASKQNKGLLHRTAPQFAATNLQQWPASLIRLEQEKDVEVFEALLWVEKGEKPPWKQVQSKAPMVKALWRQFESLVLRERVLHRIFHDKNGFLSHYQVVLPTSLRSQFLELVHNDAAGHLKLEKSAEHVQRRVWWLFWLSDLRQFIERCTKCAAYFRGNPPRQAYLRPLLVGAPGELWFLDLVGPMPQSQGYSYIFTAMDGFSKYAVACPIRHKDAQTVAKVLVERIILLWGRPLCCLTDLGTEFENDLARELYNLLGIDKLRSSGYRPQTAGALERWHRVLNSMLAKVVSEHQRDWPSLLSYVTFCYNASCHSATGYSPFFLMTGRDPRWNVDFILDNPANQSQTSVPEYVQEVRNRLATAHEIVRRNLQTAADTAADWYNKKVKPQTFYPGAKVRLYYPRRFRGRSAKLQSNYILTGEILQQLNESTYLVKTSKGRQIFHVDKIKLIPSE